MICSFILRIQLIYSYFWNFIIPTFGMHSKQILKNYSVLHCYEANNRGRTRSLVLNFFINKQSKFKEHLQLRQLWRASLRFLVLKPNIPKRFCQRSITFMQLMLARSLFYYQFHICLAILSGSVRTREAWNRVEHV